MSLCSVERIYASSNRYGENKGSKQALLDIQNPGVVISFLLVFVQFVAFFECFVFMALSVRIKIPYIEKCAVSARAFTDTFPLKSTEAHGSETKSSQLLILLLT